VSPIAASAGALSASVRHLAERTATEALHAVEEIGREIGSAVVRAARGSIKAAEDIGGDLLIVGRDVSQGVAGSARQLAGEASRLASGLWAQPPRIGRTSTTPARKAPAKAPRRRRRKSAA
jgi:hypothetical protein